MFVYYGQCIYGFFVGYEILNSTAKCSINLDDHINDCGVIKRKSQLEKPKFARKPLNDMAFANSWILSSFQLIQVLWYGNFQNDSSKECHIGHQTIYRSSLLPTMCIFINVPQFINSMESPVYIHVLCWNLLSRFTW